MHAAVNAFIHLFMHACTRMRKTQMEKQGNRKHRPARHGHGRMQRLHTPGACTRDEAPTAGAAVLGQIRETAAKCVAKTRKISRPSWVTGPERPEPQIARWCWAAEGSSPTTLLFLPSHARLRATAPCLKSGTGQFQGQAGNIFEMLCPCQGIRSLGRCRIPDDCIDEKRYPLFMARAVLRELIESLQSTGSVSS